MKSGKLWFSDEVMLQFEPATCGPAETKKTREKRRSPDFTTEGSSDLGRISPDEKWSLFLFVANQALFLGRMGRLQRRLLTGAVARRAAGIRGYAAVQSVRRNRGNFFA